MFNLNYKEQEYCFDISYEFDYTRAGITENQFKEILQNGVRILKDGGKISASEKLESELIRMGWKAKQKAIDDY